MKEFLSKNKVTLIIVFATVILAGIAIFTAIRLYQLRQQAVAPNVPESQPAAATVAPTTSACQALTFTLSTSPTPTPSILTCTTATDKTLSATNFNISTGAVIASNQSTLSIPANTSNQSAVVSLKQDLTGDFEINTHITSFSTSPTANTANGVGIIGFSGSSNINLSLSTNNDGEHIVTLKYSNGSGSAEIGSKVITQTSDISLKLVRLQDQLTGYYKVGNGSFQQVGTSTIPTLAKSNTQLSLQLKMSSNQSTTTSTAVLDNFAIYCPSIATSTPTITPSSTPIPQCGTSCGSNNDCPTSMVCYVGVCRNPSCTSTSSCVCATAFPVPSTTAAPTVAPTKSPIAALTPTPVPSTLPVSGSVTPTILGVASGVILLLVSIAFVL